MSSFHRKFRFGCYRHSQEMMMANKLIVLLGMVALGSFALAEENKEKVLQFKQLPAAVQKTVQDNLNGGEIRNITKEKEDGVEQYEVESFLNGNSRDFNVDTKGNLLVLEVATTMGDIPTPAKSSILKKVADGKLSAVETFTKTGQPMMYEASYRDAKGKKHEVLVKADGTETKQ
jgi:hypothetical protein